MVRKALFKITEIGERAMLNSKYNHRKWEFTAQEQGGSQWTEGAGIKGGFWLN